MKIKYSELEKLGFIRDETCDHVAYNESGQYPIVVTKTLFQGINTKLNKVEIMAEWMQEDGGHVRIFTTNSEGDILNSLDVNSLKGLKNSIEFFKSIDEL